MPPTIRTYHRFPMRAGALFLKPLVASSSSLLSLITLLLPSVGPVNAEWLSVDSKVEEGLTVYVDPDTIRRNEDVVKLWVLTDFKTIQSVPSPPYLSAKSQREIDCAAKRIRLLAVTAFPGHMGSGERLYSYSDSKDQGIPIEPGSVAQSLWEVVCGKQ